MRWPFRAKGRLTPELPEKSASPSTRFAFRLFRQLAAQPNARNIFFSPASVMLCLWLLLEGATGETREAMAKVLEVDGLEPEALQSVIGTLKSALQIEGPGLQLEAANAIWCDHQRTPRPEYVATIREDYKAEVITLDFSAPETVVRINSWVSAKTHGKIGSILESLDPLAALVSINAIYFRDLWGVPFRRDRTLNGTFHTNQGRTLDVPLMPQKGSYSYYEDPGVQAVRLPYKTSRLAMYVFLPAKSSSLQEFRRNLNSAAWDDWMQKLGPRMGEIYLPRFKLTYQATLNSALSTLGMGIAFDPQRARFDTINLPPPEMWIEKALHRAFINVNEDGTEAAATTVVENDGASTRRQPAHIFEMIVNRPFFFAIYDDFTSTILFMGSVEETDS
jgi:serine protease inhibitor